MLLGSAAGLALISLTTSLVRFVHAQNVTVSDEQLLYSGEGWKAATQACAGVSDSAHSTSNNGDRVSYSFTGNAVFVHGQIASLVNPITAILDGEVQSKTTVKPQDTDCTILYSNTNIPNGNQAHTLVLVFTAATGASTFSISGITSSQSAASPPAIANAATSNPATALVGSTSSVSPSTTPTPTKTQTPGAIFSTLVLSGDSSGPTAGIVYLSTSSGANPTSSVINKSITQPSVITGVIGAVVGAFCGLIALLLAFIFIRRRITRQAARMKDQQNSFQYGKALERGFGPGGSMVARSHTGPISFAVHTKGAGDRHSFSSQLFSVQSLHASDDGHPPTFTVNLDRSLSNRSHMDEELQSKRLPTTPSSSRPSSVPTRSVSGSRHPPPDRSQTDDKLQSKLLPATPTSSSRPPSAPTLSVSGSRPPSIPVLPSPRPLSSTFATYGTIDGEKIPRPYVVNRTESLGSAGTEGSAGTGTSAPPPGYR